MNKKQVQKIYPGLSITGRFNLRQVDIVVEEGFNNRRVDMNHVEQLTKSIKIGGLERPVCVADVIDEDGCVTQNVLLRGHHRYHAVCNLNRKASANHQRKIRVEKLTFHGDPVPIQIAKHIAQSDNTKPTKTLARNETTNLAWKRLTDCHQWEGCLKGRPVRELARMLDISKSLTSRMLRTRDALLAKGVDWDDLNRTAWWSAMKFSPLNQTQESEEQEHRRMKMQAIEALAHEDASRLVRFLEMNDDDARADEVAMKAHQILSLARHLEQQLKASGISKSDLKKRAAYAGCASSGILPSFTTFEESAVVDF
uniref:hypothetical protein n=1 Tax=Microbulbifer agarilyticus TaxID=260552 RepID=UPI00025586DA|nr:hypothetical protein [Microbulbifer agarilyticus]